MASYLSIVPLLMTGVLSYGYIIENPIIGTTEANQIFATFVSLALIAVSMIITLEDLE